MRNTSYLAVVLWAACLVVISTVWQSYQSDAGYLHTSLVSSFQLPTAPPTSVPTQPSTRPPSKPPTAPHTASPTAPQPTPTQAAPPPRCPHASDVLHDTLTGFPSLSLSKSHLIYKESTSRNPFANEFSEGDMSWFPSMGGVEWTLMEDYGCGVLSKLFVLLERTIEERMDLVIAVDGEVVYSHSYVDLFLQHPFPFEPPLGTDHHFFSGWQHYLPIHFSSHIRVFLRQVYDITEENLHNTNTCIQEGVNCRMKVYWGISYHLYPIGSARVAPYTGKDEAVNKDIFDTNRFLALPPLDRARRWYSSPDADSPDWSLAMHSVAVPANGTVLLEEHQGPATAQGLFLQAVDDDSGEVLPLWDALSLTLQYDDVQPPQIDRVHLGSFLGSSTVQAPELVKSEGLMVGVAHMPFEVDGREEEGMVGYVHFPMPFRRSLRVWASASWDSDLCLQRNCALRVALNVRPGLPAEDGWGYFHATEDRLWDEHPAGTIVQPRRGDEVWPSLVVSGTAGHFVGAFYQFEGVGRLTEHNPNFRIDDALYPQLESSGLEDWFGFAHLFFNDKNTTEPFAGDAIHVGLKPHVLFSCYRHMPWDAMPFRWSLVADFVMQPEVIKHNTIATTVYYYTTPSVQLPVHMLSLSFPRDAHRLQCVLHDTIRHCPPPVVDPALTNCGNTSLTFETHDLFSFVVHRGDMAESCPFLMVRRGLDHGFSNQMAAVGVSGGKSSLWLMSAHNPVQRCAQSEVILHNPRPHAQHWNLTFVVLSEHWVDVAYDVWCLPV